MRIITLMLFFALTLHGVAQAEMKIENGEGAVQHQDMLALIGDSTVLGNLRIDAPFARATLPNQPVAGGFMTISNSGTADDRLIAAVSTSAARMEIHEMKMDGDVMQMREIEGGLVIPAGETVMLAPGGLHIMFMELARPFVAGDVAEVTLKFENAGDVTLPFPIVARNGMNTNHGQNSPKGAKGS